MSYDAATDYIHKAVMYGASHIGLDASAQVMEPLAWYIYTGRASHEFTARLAAKSPTGFSRCFTRLAAAMMTQFRLSSGIWVSTNHPGRGNPPTQERKAAHGNRSRNEIHR